MKTTWTVAMAMAVLAAAGCADQKDPVTQAQLDAVDVNESKEDSLTRPTGMGEIAIGDSLEGDLLLHSAYHAWSFLPTVATRVKVEATAAAPGDMYLIVYKKSGSRFTRVTSNDDCSASTYNSCLTLSVTPGEYRFVVTTYEAISGYGNPDVNYSLSVACAAAGGCGVQRACGSRGLAACPGGQYCAFSAAAMCGAADHPGVCTARPQACTFIYKPVCGCDGQTHGNACSAASAGVSVAHDGECAPAQQACGSRGLSPCAAGQYCAFSAAAQCGAADAPGVCAQRPEACTQQYAPVCGCDGQTHGNACSAASAGVSVASQGPCPNRRVP
jgi:Kazal-type serine protease inhibitor domain